MYAVIIIAHVAIRHSAINNVHQSNNAAINIPFIIARYQLNISANLGVDMAQATLVKEIE